MHGSRRRSRALLPFLPSLPLFTLLLFWAGPGTLLPSRNCHPTQSFVLRDVQGLPFVSPDTRCPSLLLLPFVFCHPPMFGLSRRFFTAHAILVSSSGPRPAVSPPPRLLPCRATYSFRPCDRPARVYTG